MLKVPDSEAASAPWFPSLHVGHFVPGRRVRSGWVLTHAGLLAWWPGFPPGSLGRFQKPHPAWFYVSSRGLHKGQKQASRSVQGSQAT